MTNTTPDKSYVVGMDIGGTNSVMGIVDKQGNILCTDTVKTGQYTQVEDYVDAVCSRLLPLIDKYGGPDHFRGMGIGAPNANFYKGTIEQAPNLPWKGIVPLADMFSQRTRIPVAMTNDANAAALGEMTYGAARGMKDFIMITLGTGVGSGIVINGQVVYGHDGFAGELGHVCVDRSPQARLCGCGRRGCLETYCSATGVARTAREVLETCTATDSPSSTCQLVNSSTCQLDSPSTCQLVNSSTKVFFLFALLFHLTGYLLRWYIGGRIPLSNGPETMLFLALCIMVLAWAMRRRFAPALAFGFLLSGFALLVAYLGEMNPQITPLMPVLVSPWLSLHVSVIMMAYALFAFIMLNGVWALCVPREAERLEVYSRLMLYPAVFLLLTGIFMGAVWANVSWGRYWGWDPKEVWALISVMIYALPMHKVPLTLGRGTKSFHVYMVVAFLSILITYFGVNFFLGGMHSYA